MEIIRAFVVFMVVPFLFLACQEKEPQSTTPIVLTGSVKPMGSSEICFNGDVIAIGNVVSIDYGFVWSPEKNPPTVSDYCFRVKKQPPKGCFSAEINYDLFNDSISYVRAFVETADAVIYGEVQRFSSKASRISEITAISPTETTGNDTITITGEYFTSRASDIEVKYQYKNSGYWEKAKVVFADGRKIGFVLSTKPFIYSSSIFLSVKIRGKEIYSEGQITTPISINVGPKIVGFYPQKVSKSGIVKIKVQNMKGTLNDVYFHSKEYAYSQEIVKVDGDSITLKLKNLDYGKYEIQLVSTYNGLTYTGFCKDSLTVMHPEISAILENSPSAGDSITVLGRYFNSECSLYISNTACPFEFYVPFKIIHSNTIKIALPETLLDGNNQISFNTYDKFTSKIPLQIRSKWSFKNKLPGVYQYATSILYGDKIIFGNWASNSNSTNNSIYDFKTNSFESYTPSPEASVYPISFVYDDKLYLFKSYNANQSAPKSYCLNLSSKLWTSIESIKWPSASDSFLDFYTTGSYKGKVYLKSKMSTEVYSFDPDQCLWKYQNSIPLLSEDKSFMIERTSGLYFYYMQYFYSGSRCYSELLSSKLDEVQNTWNQESKFGNISGIVKFLAMDKDYFWFVTSGNIHQYTIDGKLIKSYANSLINSDNPICLFHEGKYYALVLFSDNVNYLIEFDPNKY